MITHTFWGALLKFAFGPIYFGSTPSPPPPDPAIGQAAAANAEVGREALAFQKQVYEESKPRQAALDDLTDRMIGSFIDTQRKQDAVSDEYLDYMRTTFRPIEQQLAEEAASFNTEARRNELAMRAAADVEQEAAAADAQARREAARFGINPADGAFADNLAGSALNRAAMRVGAMNNATAQARAEGRAMQFDVAGLGRGLPAAGATSAQLGLQAGSAALGAGVTPINAEMARASGVGGGFNQAMAGHQSQANILSGLYGQQLGAWNTQVANQASALGGIGSLIGTLGGAYLLRPPSSKELKTNMRKVAASGILKKIKKLPVEEWDYKEGEGDGGRHIGPYAEDVQKQFGDAAAPSGKVVDLLSLNGIALAGIKALAEEVGSLKRGMRVSAARFGLKQDRSTWNGRFK